MKLKNRLLVVLLFTAILTSCKKNDDDNVISVPDRDRTEQQLEDKDSLIGYLETHYYNASAFVTPGNYSMDDIIISELPQDDQGNYLALPDPDNNTLLIDDVETFTTTYQDTEYEYYVLKLNHGAGESPNFTDNVTISYTGFMQDGDVFDSTANPVILDIIGNQITTFGVIKGWRDVLTDFGTASGPPTINEDGTLQYDDYGFGVMFLPSGLAYFANPPFGIAPYSNLIFKFELYRTQPNDHDNDGVYSHLEDLNGNETITDDDTDGDDLANFVDADDDGDGVATRFEDLDGDGDPTNDDSNGDGIPNYLDPEATESNQDE